MLWFCTEGTRRRLNATPRAGNDAGRLLDYPPCCVAERLKNETDYRIAILDAMIPKIGDDKELVKRAILSGERVTVSKELLLRVSLSNEQFPFVSHVACATCYEDSESPSALLDEQYRLLTKEIDPFLHDGLIRAARLIGQVEDVFFTGRQGQNIQ